jgi:hypothetical protein
MSETNGDSVWKNVALFLAGMVLAGGGSMLAQAHDSMPRAEVEAKIREVYQRIDQQSAGLNGHLESIDRTQIDMGKEIVRISEHLGVTSRPVGPH